MDKCHTCGLPDSKGLNSTLFFWENQKPNGLVFQDFGIRILRVKYYQNA